MEPRPNHGLDCAELYNLHTLSSLLSTQNVQVRDNASDHELSTSESNMGHCFCIFLFSWFFLLSSARRKRLRLWRRHCCLVLGTRWVGQSCLLAPGSWPNDGGGEERIAESIFQVVICTVKPKRSNSVQNMP